MEKRGHDLGRATLDEVDGHENTAVKLFEVRFEDADGVVAGYEAGTSEEQAIERMRERIAAHMPERVATLTFLDCTNRLASPEYAAQTAARPRRADGTERAVTRFPVETDSVDDRIQSFLEKRSDMHLM